MRAGIIISFLLGFCSTFAGYGQGDWIPQKDEIGYYYSPGDSLYGYDWQANWIWVDESLDKDVLLARRAFNLNQIPKKSELWITASSQYQLYINGEYVRRGPARSAPHHQSFDVLNVKKYLKEGINLVAARVHHQDHKFAYQINGRAGLLAQLNLEFTNGTQIIKTDTTWKSTFDPAWDETAPVIGRFQMVVNDRVDFRNADPKWWSIQYDDQHWPNAIPMMRNVGWPLPQNNADAQTLTPPWTSLIPRDVPYLIEKGRNDLQLIEARPIDEDYLRPFKTENHKLVSGIALLGTIEEAISSDLDGFTQGNKPIKVDGTQLKKPYMLLYDLKKLYRGHAQLTLRGGQGSTVDILYAPYLLNGHFGHNFVDSEFRDQITLSGNLDQWEATYFKPFRYLAIIIQPGETLEIHKTAVRYLHYPFHRQGNIRSSDASWIEQYVEATERTIDHCTTDAYTDNYRERRQYAQTGYYGALGNYWTYGDLSLQRRYLIQIAQEQNANGIMPAYAPLAKDDYMIIMDSNCLYIRSLRNYYLYSGDHETVQTLLPAASKLMDLLHSYTNELGMIENPPYPYWLDHALLDRRGANLILNGHYLGALDDFTEVLEWLGQSSSTYSDRAKRLRKNLQIHFWNEDQKLFADALIDGRQSTQFSEGSSAMALACEVATADQAAAVADILLRPGPHNFIHNQAGQIMVTPAMSYFLHKGLCEYGYVTESFDLFRRRFDHMLLPEHNGTLWEEWWLTGTGRSGTFNSSKSRSDAQTESAFAPALFAEYLLGVQPTKPGFREVEIKKYDSDLRQIAGKFATPLGELFLEWNFEERQLDIKVPFNMLAKIKVNSLQTAMEEIRVNDENISTDTSYIDLSSGTYTIRF